MSDSNALTETQPQSMEVLHYKEELASKMGLPSPFGINLMKQVCQDMVDSGLVPTCFNKNPAAVFLAAMRGRELGLDPFESVLETFWVAPGNKLGMYANKMLAMLHREGVKTKFVREDAGGCEVLFTPPGDHEPYTGRFLFEEAEKARLVKPDSNWIKWPADMCRARAIARGWRALAGVFFKTGANLYAKEEMDDFERDPSEDRAAKEDERRMEVLQAKEFRPGRRSQAEQPPVQAEAAPPEPEHAAPEPQAEPAEKKPRSNRKPREASDAGKAPWGGLFEKPAAQPDAAPAKPAITVVQTELKPYQQGLYQTLKCKSPGQFWTYWKGLGLDQLDEPEAVAYCRLATLLGDTTQLVEMVNTFRAEGACYQLVIDQIEADYGQPIEEVGAEVIRKVIAIAK